MTIKQNGGVFGRNPTFNDVTIEGDLILNGETFTGLDFNGSWNANSNSPTLSSGTGTQGEFYIVSVAGTTNLDGVTNWGVGDYCFFNGTAWQRIEGGADGNFATLTTTGNATIGGNLEVQGADFTITANVKHAGDNSFFGFHGNDLYRVVTGGVERFEVSNSEINFNDGGNDQDFRVESDTNANMLFVDAANNRVGVGTGSPSHTMHVVSSGNGEIKAERTSGTAVIIQAQAAAGKIGTTTNHNLGLNTNGTTRLTIDTNGKVLIGDPNSHTSDFLQIETPASGGGHGIQIRRNDANGDQTVGAITFGNNTDTDLAQISAKTDGDGNSGDSGALLFSTQTTGGSLAERARITSAGKIRLGNSGDHVMIDLTASNAALELIDNNQTNPPTLRGNGPNFTIENGGLEMMRISSTTATVFNEASQNIDFRIESDSNTHALFVDAGNNQIGIGTSGITSSFLLGVQGKTALGDRANSQASGGFLTELSGTSLTDGSGFFGSYGTLNFFANSTYTSTARRWQITNGFETNKFALIVGDTDSSSQPELSGTGGALANGIPALYFNNVGAATFNESSQDADFRVESNNNTHALFVDAGNDAVAFGTSDPATYAFGSGSSGSAIWSNGLVAAAKSDAIVGIFNRTTSNGTILEFRKDGTAMGNISSRAGVVTTIVLNPASGNGAGLSGGTKAVVPADEAGIIDNDISLGVSTHRFKDLYLSNNLILNEVKLGGGSATIADDAVGSFTTPKKGGIAIISNNPEGAFPGGPQYYAMFFYDAGDSLNILKLTNGLGQNIDVTTSDVTGTTGTDGNVTVAVQANTIKVENRQGSSRDIQLTFL